MSDTYPFDPAFERSVIALLTTSDRFFGLIGPYLDPARFRDPLAQVLAAEARDLYEQIGKAPGSLPVILQRLRTKHDRGKLSLEDLGKCADYLCDALDLGVPDVDVAVHEVSLVLKRVEQQQVLDQAFVTYAERGDMTPIAEAIQRAESIGKVDVSYGASLDGFDEELELRGVVERMPTGFVGLDVAMGGGFAKGEFAFWLAGPKVGKSMALVQNAVIGLMRGMHVAVATLELDTVMWRARVLGALTGTPYQDILKYGKQSVAFERLRVMQEDPYFNIGKLSIQKFVGHQTKVPAVLDWVAREEERSKIEVSCLVVDYADKLEGRNSRDGTYEQMRDVYENIRVYTSERKINSWSASQAVRIPLGEMPTVNSCADSQHKVRITDGMIGITRHPDDDNKVSAKLLALRNAMGEGTEVGPLPNGFDYGCFVRNVASGVDVEEALVNGQDLGIFT